MKITFFMAFVMDPATLQMRASRVFETSGLPATHRLIPGDRSSRLQSFEYVRTRKVICSPLPFRKEIIKVMIWPYSTVPVLIFEPPDWFPRNVVWTLYYWGPTQSIYYTWFLTLPINTKNARIREVEAICHNFILMKLYAIINLSTTCWFFMLVC